MMNFRARKTLKELEQTLTAASGDARLARRICQDIGRGRVSPAFVFANLERTVARNTGSSRDGRQFRVSIQAVAQETVKQNQTPAERAKPLIENKLLGWAKDPKSGAAVLVMRDKGCKIVDEKGKPITDSIAKVSYPHKGTLSLADFLAHAEHPEEGENSIAYFYQDGGKNVTIGIGHLVADEAEARQLANTYFFFRLGAAEITKADVVDAFRAARDSRTASPGKAHTFENVSDVRLEFTDIHKLFEVDVNTKLRELKARKEFRDYATYPPDAKLGLLDIAFTSGVGKILQPSKTGGFPVFTSGVRHRDWEEAAEESNRGEVSPKRNAKVRMWFLKAAKQEPYFLRSPLSKSARRRPCDIALDTLIK